MAIPAEHSPHNVRYSVQEYLRVNFAVVYAGTYVVNFADAFFDLDQRDEESAVVQKWVHVQLLQSTGGMKGATIFQFDCYSRVGTRENGDPLGADLALMVARLQAVLTQPYIPLYDFITNQASPALVPRLNVLVQNSRGQFRCAEDHQNLGNDGTGVLREILTYRFVTPLDLAGGFNYDEGP